MKIGDVEASAYTDMMITTILALIGATALLITACYHLTGLREVAAGSSGERLRLMRAAWVGIAIDWALIAAAWIAAAFGHLPASTLGLGAALTFASSIVVAIALGLRFPGVWLLAGASLCAVAAQSLR